MDAEEFLLTSDEWTQVVFNASSAIVIVPLGISIRAHVGGEEAPPPEITNYFPVRSLRIIRGIAPFQALWLRADTATPVTVTVYKGNSMTGVVYFGKSPFRLRSRAPVEIEVPYVPQVLDGGAPDTDYTGLAVIDCGGVIQDPAVRTIDGRIAGEAP